MNVMTYNIHHAEGTDGVLDLARIAGVIRAVGPQVVLLQEVDHGTRRARQLNQAEALAGLLGCHFAFGEAMPLQGGFYGEAVLSVYPVLATRVHPLPHAGDHEPRCALEVQVEVPGLTKPLVLLATHLDHLHSPERVTQVRKILAWLDGYRDREVLFGGDINAEPGSEEMDLLDAAMGRAVPGPPAVLGRTYPSDEPATLIDHIFFYPREAWATRSVASGVALRPGDKTFSAAVRVASDHVPLTADLELLIGGAP